MTPLRKSGKNYRMNRVSPEKNDRKYDTGKKSVYGFLFSDDINDWMTAPAIQGRRKKP